MIEIKCFRKVALLLVYFQTNLAKIIDTDLMETAEPDHRQNIKALLMHVPFTMDEEAGNQKRYVQWPLGVVPYYFDNSVYDGLVANRVRLAMNSIEESSCVQFKTLHEPWHDEPWIHITNPLRVRACVHENEVNSTGSEIVMVLGLDCLQRRDILHSLMHALGFKDEITHPKRDQFVRILWDNINPSFRSLFHINYENVASYTAEYDPTSIMHFHDRAFTKNGRATIAPIIPGLVINPSRDLSPLDKMQLRTMFGHECNRRKVENIVDVCKEVLQENGGDDEVIHGVGLADKGDGQDKGDDNANGQSDDNNGVDGGDGDNDNADDEGPEENDNNEAEQDGANVDGDSLKADDQIDNVTLEGEDKNTQKLLGPSELVHADDKAEHEYKLRLNQKMASARANTEDFYLHTRAFSKGPNKHKHKNKDVKKNL